MDLIFTGQINALSELIETFDYLEKNWTEKE
jgi:hypothetical protein